MTTTINHVFPSFSKRHTVFKKYGEISQESISLFQEKASLSLLLDLLIPSFRNHLPVLQVISDRGSGKNTKYTG